MYMNRCCKSVSKELRVTTCLENLEISGILRAVREMSGMLLKVGGKNPVREKWLKLFICLLLVAYLRPYRYLVASC